MDPNNLRLLAGSPSSSEAVASTQNTPETKLTAFSPEELRSSHRAVKTGIVRPNVPPAFALNIYARPSSSGNAGNPTASTFSDPFVGPSNLAGIGLSASDLPKLSPAATSFTPLGRQGLSVPVAAVKHRDETNESRATTPRPNDTSINLAAQNMASTAATGAAQSSASSNEASAFPKVGNFTSDYNTSRYLMVGQVAMRTPLTDLEAFFTVRPQTLIADRRITKRF